MLLLKQGGIKMVQDGIMNASGVAFTKEFN
jgi:hypothetical protein